MIRLYSIHNLLQDIPKLIKFVRFTDLANMECKVIDIVAKHNIVVLEAVAAYIDTARKEKRTVLAVGDGTFIVDGLKIGRRKMMASKIPFGV